VKRFYLFVLLIATANCFFATSIKAQKAAGTGALVIDTSISAQLLPKIRVAPNGWIYTGFITNNDYRIFKSTDNGNTWTKLVDELTPLSDWDLELTGGTYTDTAIKIWMAGIARTNDVRVLSYNGRNGTPTAKLFWEPPFGDTCKNIALATDYKNPGFVANPFSIAMAFTVDGQLNDSLLFFITNDSGSTWKHSTVYKTINYLHRVSLAYGYSPFNNTGRFFLAGEYNYTRTASFYNQDIFYLWEKEDLSGYVGLGYVDSVDKRWVANVSHPDVIVENSSSNENDSLDLSAMILFNTGDGLRAITTLTAVKNTTSYKNWFANNVFSNYDYATAPTSANGVYDQQNASFIFAAGDTVNRVLNYYARSIDSTGSPIDTNGYVPFKIIYTDTVHHYHLVYADPHCDANPIDSLPVADWIGDMNGDSLTYTLFSTNASSLVSGISALSVISQIKLFPDPANQYINIVLPKTLNATIGIEVYDLLGQKMAELPNIQNNSLKLDVSKWPTGSYFVRVLDNQNWQIIKFIVLR